MWSQVFDFTLYEVSEAVKVLKENWEATSTSGRISGWEFNDRTVPNKTFSQVEDVFARLDIPYSKFLSACYL